MIYGEYKLTAKCNGCENCIDITARTNHVAVARLGGEGWWIKKYYTEVYCPDCTKSKKPLPLWRRIVASLRKEDS